MTTEEFNFEFDIGYNNIAGASAPPIDIFEKSVYLTTAQEQIIKNHYDSTSNSKGRGFEGSEKRRNDLKQLIKDYKTTSFISNTSNISNQGKFYILPKDLFLIVNEQVQIISTDCYNGNVIDVKPVTYDEYNVQINNPFKRPDNTIAWRLDISNINNNEVVEIISPYNISNSLQYRLRYLKQPKPIILGDLDILYPLENLTINSENTTMTCELDESIHREILDRAIELALQDYKPQNLQSEIQLNTRNE